MDGSGTRGHDTRGVFSVFERKRDDGTRAGARVQYLGGPVAHGRLFFCKDLKHVVGAGGKRLRVFNPQVGLPSHEISIAEYLDSTETAELVGVSHDGSGKFYTVSNHDCIDVWPLDQDCPVKSIRFNSKISGVAVDPKNHSSMYVLSTTRRKGDNASKSSCFDHTVYRLDLETLTAIRCFAVPSKGLRINVFRISNSGDVIVCAYAKELCAFRKIDSWKSPIKIRADEDITCLSISPNDSTIAIGDKAGRITLMHENLGSKNSSDSITRTPRTTLHWHSQRVNCVEFSPDGLMLISGGLEMVLVFWYLEENLKRFLPRLQSPIRSVTPSPNGSSVVALFYDNSAGLFSVGSMTRIGSISGPNEVSTSGIHYKHTFGRILDNSYLILQKRNGMIQLFNYITDRPVFEVDITCETLVSLPDSNRAPGSRVECLAVSKDGKWMVTTDRYDADSDEKDVSTTIKIWNRCQSEYGFTLSTRIYSAHNAKIVSAEISPHKSHMFATSSEDHTFKIWTLKEGRWTSNGAQNFRDETPSSVTFSNDGAVLAVVYPKVISLWDPFSHSLVATLPFQETPSSQRGVEFIFDSYIVSYTRKKLCVWDLSSLTVLWCIYIAVRNISVLDNSGTFAVAVDEGNDSVSVFLFNVLDPTPVDEISTRSGYVHSRLLRQSSGVAVAILYSDSSVEIHTTSRYVGPIKPVTRDYSEQKVDVNTSSPVSESTRGATSPAGTYKSIRTSNWVSVNPEYASTPSYMLGSVTSLCSEYLKFQLAAPRI